MKGMEQQEQQEGVAYFHKARFEGNIVFLTKKMM